MVAPLLSHFYTKATILPRQTRDKHEEKLRNKRGCLQAKEDPMVAGFNPWHFYNWSGPAMPGCNGMRLGAVAQPKLMEELRKVGSYIKKGGASATQLV